MTSRTPPCPLCRNTGVVFGASYGVRACACRARLPKPQPVTARPDYAAAVVNQGWQCPVCRRVHPAFVPTCDCTGSDYATR